LQQIATYLCPQGSIHFIACDLFSGQNGHKLEHNLASIFPQQKVVGYDQDLIWGDDDKVYLAVPPYGFWKYIYGAPGPNGYTEGPELSPAQ